MPDIDVIDLGEDYWTKHLLDKIPAFWSGDDAKKPPTNTTPSGGLWGLLAGMGSMLEVINQDLVYAYNGTRIQTAEGEALDLAAQDFFGFALPRKIGEPDEAYRIRILAALLESKVARDPIQSLVERFTGATVRMLQSDSPRDCGGLNAMFLNTDSVLTPARVTSVAHRHVAYLDVDLPAQSGPHAEYGLSAGFFLNHYSAALWIPTPNNLITPQDVQDLVQSAVGWPMRVAIRFNKTTLPTLKTGLVESVPLNAVEAYPNIFPAFPALYYVFASSSDVSSIWFDVLKPSNFHLQFSSPQPADSVLSHLAVSPNIPGVKQQGVLPGATTKFYPYNPAIQSLVVLPNWNTTPYIQSQDSNGSTLGLLSSPGGRINFLVYPHGPYAGRNTVTSGETSHVYSAPTGPNFINLALCSWATKFGLTPLGGNQVRLDFQTPPPDANQYFEWVSYPLKPQLFYGGSVGILSQHRIASTSVVLPIASPYAVFCSATYPTNIWADAINLSSVSFQTNILAPDNETVRFLVLSQQINGARVIPILPSKDYALLSVNRMLSVVVACADWNTPIFTTIEDEQTVVNCATAAGPDGGNLSILVYPKGVNAGRIDVPAGRQDFTFDANSDQFHTPIVTPNWATTYSVIPLSNNLIKVEFTTAAPAGAQFDYVTYPLS